MIGRDVARPCWGSVVVLLPKRNMVLLVYVVAYVPSSFCRIVREQAEMPNLQVNAGPPNMNAVYL